MLWLWQLETHHRYSDDGSYNTGFSQYSQKTWSGHDGNIKRVWVEGNFDNGAWVAPTVFTDCRDEMTIVREEIFGPVMSLLTYESEDEVIRRANDTDYGLAAGIVTADLNRAHRVIHQLEAGICWINTWGESPAEMPVGGYKHSGIGRENGVMTLQSYTQVKSIQVEMAKFQSIF